MVDRLWAPWRLEYIQGADEDPGCVFCRAAALDDDAALEIHRLAATALQVLAEAMHPEGYNLGWNLGRAAGAGVRDHVHQHVVPRWGGDTNFMPVLADVKVLPEALAATRAKLAAAWP